MRLRVFFSWVVITVLLTGFCSCSDDNDEGSFGIGKSEVFIMIGNKDNVFIYSYEGTYTVKSLDESIATGEIRKTDNEDGSTTLLSVSVTPVAKGKTTLVISNGVEEKNVDVTVVDPYMVFEVGQQTLSVIGETENKAIMEELKSSLLLTMGTVFMLVKDENNTMYLYENKEDVTINELSKSGSGATYKLKGTYELEKSKDKLYIILKSGDRSFRFEIGGNANGKYILNSFFNINGMKSKNSVPEYLAQVSFMENLTDEYNQKYEEALFSVTRDHVCTILNQRIFWLPFE